METTQRHDHFTSGACPDPVECYIRRIDYLEIRYKGTKHAEQWLIPADVLKAVRDRLKPQEIAGPEQISLFEI